jgi:two-component system, NarL family, nitrate/nitrite response regulator NarL
MRILLADRQALVRDLIASFFEASGLPNMTPCTTMADVETALAAQKHDLVIIDAAVGGVEEVAALIATHPGQRVAMLIGTNARDQVDAVLRTGAVGAISRTMSGPAVVEAVRRMLAGEKVDPVRQVTPGAPVHEQPYALTRRELDVLRGLFAGKSNKEIGRDLELQEVTVKLHVKTLSRKLAAKNRTHAAMIARNEGLV